MKEQSQLLNHRKVGREVEAETEAHTCGAPQLPVCPSDHRDERFSPSSDCRECLAAMAHRLSQPMTALRGALELGLMGERSAPDYRALLEQSLQLTDSLAQLIISLRDLAESDAPGGAPQPLSLAAGVEEVLAEMEGFALSRDLRLQLHVIDAANVCVDPERLREALQSLLGWVIRNSAGGGVITVQLRRSETNTQVLISPPRLDLQYLQIKVLEDITTPGLIFSHASKYGALGWVINQRLVHGLGGRLEMLTEGPEAGSIRATLPQFPACAG